MANIRPRSNSKRDDPRNDAEVLVDASQNPEAFGTFYLRNIRSITVYFFSRTRDHDDSSELAAETFAVALSNVGRYDPAKGTPQQWLFGIARNQLKTFWRKNRVSLKTCRKLKVQMPPTADTGWQEIEVADARLDADHLSKALSRVPPRSREAVRLRMLKQLDYSEIAEMLECKPATARSLVQRGLRRLADEFDSPC